MALEWAGEEEKPQQVPPNDFWNPDWGGGGFLSIDFSAIKEIQEIKGYHWIGENTPIPQPPGVPTITFKHGDVEKSIALSDNDLKPRFKFKLHQKVDALIKQAYNK